MTGDAGLLDGAVAIARAAAAAILAARGRGGVRTKADATPVTDADEAANALIVERLTDLAPEIPIIAEESVAAGHVPAIGTRFWLVDPLDGTREFVAGRDEYTVNIALIVDTAPVLGVVGAPATGTVHAGLRGRGAFAEDAAGARRAIAARTPPRAGPVALASRSHMERRTEDWLATAGAAEVRHFGSSLKFCVIAEGAADVYPRFGRTMEWDTAAGHAVLAAAGGSVRTVDGRDLAYGKPGFENPPFIARGAEDRA